MSMLVEDVKVINSLLMTAKIAGNEAVAFATAVSLLGNAVKRVPKGEISIEATDIPNSFWSNIVIFLERAELRGGDVGRYLDVLSKARMFALAKPKPKVELNDDTKVINEDIVAHATDEGEKDAY